MSNWSLAVSLPTLIIGCAIMGLAAWLSWLQIQRAGNRRWVKRLEVLRLFMVALIVFTLMKPEYVRELNRDETPVVAVLKDGTASMETRDVVLNEKVVTRAEWLNARTEGASWIELGAGVSLVQETFPSDEGTAAVKTDLTQALEEILARHPGLRSVLLFTDGDWNSGKSPIGTATRFRDRGIPIFSVAVGSESPLPDLELTDVQAPSYSLTGEQVSITANLKSQLNKPVETTLFLEEESGKTLSSKAVVIPANGSIQETLIWLPESTGDQSLRLRFPVHEEETQSDNNQIEFKIQIRMEMLNVLVVDSTPRWEYRYLRNALARDPGVNLHCVLLHPGMQPGGGRDYLPGFPGSQMLISRYDVVFLGDVGLGPGELRNEDAELLRGLVEQQASGLVFIPGRKGRQSTFANSPLAELYPVVLDEEQVPGIPLQNEAKLLLTKTGENHLLTRFDSDPDRNAELWKLLPGFYWSTSVVKSRPGSEVLAVHSLLRNSWGRMPLLVTRPHGNGKVLFMGTDSAWRWRRGVEDKFHYRLWSQVVRWMAHSRNLAEKEGIRLTFSPEAPEVGDIVFLQASVLDQGGFPIQSGKVISRIQSPSGKTEVIELNPVQGGWGVFEAQFKPVEGGLHRIQTVSPENNRELDTDLEVVQPVLEKKGEPINRTVLAEISRITSGRHGGVSALDEMVESIRLLPEPEPFTQRTRMWSHPAWGGFLLFLLALYWTGRKYAGML